MSDYSCFDTDYNALHLTALINEFIYVERAEPLYIQAHYILTYIYLRVLYSPPMYSRP
jgi:hypothetical protein